MKPRSAKPWAEFLIYLLVFLVVGTGLYLLKRAIKGPPRPTHVPMESPEDLRPTHPR